MNKAQSVPQIQFVISLYEDGNINVVGPINDKLLCYGMLEVARDIVAAASKAEFSPVEECNFPTPGIIKPSSKIAVPPGYAPPVPMEEEPDADAPTSH